jgi:acetyltransferase
MTQPLPTPEISMDQSLHLVTRSGLRLSVRQAAPGDEPQILDFLNSVSPEDLRFRFLSAVKPSDALAHMLTRTNFDKVENLVAFDAADGRIVASATIAAESTPMTAEVAVIVRQDRKGHGIGWTMLSQICDLARIRGFRRVECLESSDNRTAIQLEQELGFIRQPYAGDATLTILTKDLQEFENE